MFYLEQTSLTQDFCQASSWKAVMPPITSAEPASRLASLTDDFDLSKHEDLLG